MKKIISILMFTSVFMLSFQSCEKKEKTNNLKANEIQGVTPVKAEYVLARTQGNYEVIGKGDVDENNKFSITLKTPVNLTLISDSEFKDEFIVSNPKAKIAYLKTLLLGRETGFPYEMCYGKVSSKNKDMDVIMYFYSDGATDIKGDSTSGEITKTYNIHLQEGWNLINMQVRSTIDSNENSKTNILFKNVSSIPSDYTWQDDSILN